MLVKFEPARAPDRKARPVSAAIWPHCSLYLALAKAGNSVDNAQTMKLPPTARF